MKKKVLAIVLIVSLMLSMIPFAAFADGDQGGLDFYSITIHYEEPVVVSYRKVAAKDKEVIIKYKADGSPVYGKGYVFAEPVTEYYLRAGENLTNGYTQWRS